MPTQIEDEQEETPLDPAMEKVRRKMVRLLAVSIGIMFIGVMAVLGAIVYKFTRPATPQAEMARSAGVPSDAPASLTMALPGGFSVDGISLDGGRLAYYGHMADGQERVILFDIAVGRIVAEISVTRQKPE